MLTSWKDVPYEKEIVTIVYEDGLQRICFGAVKIVGNEFIHFPFDRSV